MKFVNLKFRTQIFLGNSLLLLILVLVSAVVYQTITSMIETADWEDHTHRVIEHGNGLVTEMINMETGVRGYLVTGKEEFLEPYESGQRDFYKLMSETKELVSDNPPTS